MKTDKEHQLITKKFYVHLCDIVVETIKTFSLKPTKAMDRMTVVNPEIPDYFFNKGIDILIVGGHYSNWEALTYSANSHLHDLFALYTPLTNKFFDKKMRDSRCKYGMTLVSTTKYKSMLKEKHATPRAYIYSIDQSPRKGSGYRMTFLNQDSMVLFGSEKTAKENNFPVIFGVIRKVKRGYFEIEYELIEDNPDSTKHGEITERITHKLEKIIEKDPEYWLWTHKRWKHKPL